ncbi:hypothetical protein P22_3179 [Propionispora sp. 2/2-37]|uniref:S-layer homology domain-containing protein n=1 Tax=Propionispora sp. 2/2-37 TaxID=1677858 RepID=UPI0006BB68D3|nr:S-layer homology domain-containing protein [Propionispora sp. 2/2-37]CUH97053.1 hypothetical protein P22_3179 [Propionispora sp. 2/2-37]
MKKTMAFILTLVFLLTGITGISFASDNLNRFDDVPAGHWAYEAVGQLAKDGLLEGYRSDTFEGGRTLTRYEMAKFVARAMSQSERANAEDKALINKLKVEYLNDLESLGVRVAGLYPKAYKLIPVTFATLTYSHDKISNPNGTNTELSDLRPTGPNEGANKSSLVGNKINIFSMLVYPVNDRWNLMVGTEFERNTMFPGLDVSWMGYKNTNCGDWTQAEMLQAMGRIGDVNVTLGKFGMIHNYGINLATQINGLELSYTTPLPEEKKQESKDTSTKPGGMSNIATGVAPGQVKATIRVGKLDHNAATNWNIWGMDPEKVALFTGANYYGNSYYNTYGVYIPSLSIAQNLTPGEQGLYDPRYFALQFEGTTSKATHYKVGYQRVSPTANVFHYDDPVYGEMTQKVNARTYWDVGFDTQFGKDYYFLADYSKADFSKNNVAYVLGVSYKVVDPSKPGSYMWGFSYNRMEPNSTIHGLSDLEERIIGSRGWQFMYAKVPKKNTLLNVRYALWRGINDPDFKDKSTIIETKFFL